MSQSDQRQAQLINWIQEAFPFAEINQALSGDASFRRYFRIDWNEQTFIGVDAPPPQEDCTDFIRIAECWLEQDIPVPVIIDHDLSQGFMFQEDLGDVLLSDVLTAENASHHYQQAQAVLADIAAVQHPADNKLADYDEAVLFREMNLMTEWFFPQYLTIQLTNEQTSIINDAFALLADSALQQPVVTVHRDYHSRNLMFTEGDEFGEYRVIDFQDALNGPVTYDLVSLLRDCYVRWPDALVDDLRDQYLVSLKDRGLISSDISVATFKRWFDLMGLQRHIKVLGIFARLYIRDGKTGYLNDLPRVLDYVIDVSAEYEELSAFNQLMREVALPALQKKQAV